MSYRFRFGKYKGKEIEDVPDDYLLWLYDQNVEANTAIERELKIKKPIGKPNGKDLEASVGSLRRRLAKTHLAPRSSSKVEREPRIRTWWSSRHRTSPR